ncbi:MAG: hypothetical protein ACKV2T_24270 [Kofleriaceae bacterium]
MHRLAGRDVWCEQERRGGGWTLALKIDGAQPTFRGDSALWENTTLVAETSLDPAVLDEAKLAPFVDEPVAEILLVIDNDKDVVMRMRGRSLRELFASGLTYPAHTLDSEWRAAFAPGSLQSGCRQQGLGITNRPTTGEQHRLRIGVIANNESDECETSDSFVGVGAEYQCSSGVRLAAGNMGPVVSQVCQPHRVLVYVRDDDQTRFATQPTCRAHLDRGRTTDGVYIIDGVPRRCDMTTDGGGWTNALDFDGARAPCPAPWLADPTDLRICITPGGQSSSSLFVPSPIGAYSEVMTSALAYQRSNTDAFDPAAPMIDETYLDGLSITSGIPRQHIASYASGYSEQVGCGGPIDRCNCPCLGGPAPPAFVQPGSYRCEAGARSGVGDDVLVRPEPLFDGYEMAIGCETEARGEPILSTLATPTMADIEARLLRDEPDQGEGLAIYRLEIWVR